MVKSRQKSDAIPICDLCYNSIMVGTGIRFSQAQDLTKYFQKTFPSCTDIILPGGRVWKDSHPASHTMKVIGIPYTKNITILVVTGWGAYPICIKV